MKDYEKWLYKVEGGAIDPSLDDYQKWSEHDPNIAYRLSVDALEHLIKQGIEYKWMYDDLG